MDVQYISFAPLRVVLKPQQGWVAARVASNLTSATKLPWMYRESIEDQDGLTFFVPANIDDNSVLRSAAESVQRRYPQCRVEFPQQCSSRDEGHKAAPYRGLQQQVQNEEQGFQVVASKRTRHAQRKQTEKNARQLRLCPHGQRCERRFKCDFGHTEQQKEWFRWYEERYEPRKMRINHYKASPCRYICKYGQCDLADEPWKCFGMHTSDELWCPGCMKQGEHPWHACPTLGEVKRRQVLQKHPYLASYQSMYAQGRFQSRRAHSGSVSSHSAGAGTRAASCSGRRSPRPGASSPAFVAAEHLDRVHRAG